MFTHRTGLTGYKWLDRYREEGLDGLRDRSHRPHSCPHATSAATVQRILELRKRFGWGARTIRGKLSRDPSIPVVPSTDTIGRILQRHGLIRPRKPRRRRTHPGPPVPILPEPNGTWTADFKGEFRTKDGKLCYPLTVQDGHSRFLLACRGMPRLDLQRTMRSFCRLFHAFGLPHRIRTDNGPPFATTAIGGLSQLSVWWISLGYPEHFEVRRVSGDHTIRCKSRKVFVSTVLVDHHIGLETIGDGLHSVFFGPLHLRWLDERDFRIMDVKNHTRRRR